MIGRDYDLVGVYTAPSLVICACMVMAISVLTNLLFASKLKSLNMATALKSAE